MIRLDKYLCEMQAGSRSEVKELIRHGCVAVNGEIWKRPEGKLDENRDQVCVNGSLLAYQKYIYLLLNKPAGIVSATRDSREKTVLDYIRERDGQNPLLARPLFPVGRLDKDTEGLLLLTDDGGLSHRLLSPNRHVEKTYYVEIDGELTDGQRKALENGVDIGDDGKGRDAGRTLTRPARLREVLAEGAFHSGDAKTAWELTITEGRFHQVKRMMQAVGRQVVYLKRISMGSLKLDAALKAGEFRELTKEELSLLKGE